MANYEQEDNCNIRFFQLSNVFVGPVGLEGVGGQG
jgi:hypothetical protein